jgi:hypothetical protein
MHGHEAVHVRSRLEPSHLPLALARGLMREFGPIVPVLRRAMDHGRHHASVGRRVAIAPGLHEDVDRVAVVITRAHKYSWRPRIVMNSSFRYHVSPRRPCRRRSVGA